MKLLSCFLTVGIGANAAFATTHGRTPGFPRLRRVLGREEISATPVTPVTLSTASTAPTASTVTQGTSTAIALSSALTPPQLQPTQIPCSDTSWQPTKDKPSMVYHGLNIDNHIRCTNTLCTSFKDQLHWNMTLKTIRTNFPYTNAIRMYSMMDSVGKESNNEGAVYHLMNALPAAMEQGFFIIAGVWSGGPDFQGRFSAELGALAETLDRYGCSQIAAVSVGNEDLDKVTQYALGHALSRDDIRARKVLVASLIIQQMTLVRATLRRHGCCNVPVTHTDTGNELSDTSQDYVKAVKWFHVPDRRNDMLTWYRSLRIVTELSSRISSHTTRIRLRTWQKHMTIFGPKPAKS